MFGAPLLTLSLIALPWAAPDLGSAPAAQASSQSQSQAQLRFQDMDTNRDGVITRSEWIGTPQSFRAHDWNNDGILSGRELVVGAWPDVEEPQHSPSWRERNLRWTEAGFTAIDHDRNGRITKDEWHYADEIFYRADRNRDGVLTRAEYLGADADDERDDLFEYMDANNNGVIERREWHGNRAAFDDLDRNNDGVLSRWEATGLERASTDEFRNLDADRNGVITRLEWRGARGAFNRYDTNRDGVITRREYALATGEDEGDVTSRTIAVAGSQQWTDTGMDIQAGEVVTLRATGTIGLSPDPNDIADPSGSRVGRRAPSAPLRDAPAGALIARIGGSRVILIGANRTFTSPVSGRLYLGSNDDHFPDNGGEFRVNVMIGR